MRNIRTLIGTALTCASALAGTVAVGVVIALAVLAGLFIPVVIRRRKEEQA